MIVRRIHPGIFTALWLMPVLALLQTSLTGHLALRGVAPDIVLIVVVDWGILRGTDEGLLWAFLGGLGLDVFSGWPFGTGTVALVIVAGIVSLGEGTFMRTHALVPIGTVFGATILYYGIALFILASVQPSGTGAPAPLDWVTALRAIVLPAAFYNAALNIVVFRLVSRLESKVYPMPRAHW